MAVVVTRKALRLDPHARSGHEAHTNLGVIIAEAAAGDVGEIEKVRKFDDGSTMV